MTFNPKQPITYAGTAMDALAESEVDEPHETIWLTPAQVRKLARLTRLHDENALIELTQPEREGEYHIQVEWLDEYGSRVQQPRSIGRGRRAGHAAVIRDNGWSNPSVARMAKQLVTPERLNAR